MSDIETRLGLKGAFLGAFRKGVAARKAGKPRSANPYPDHRTDMNHVTFSRAFRKAWDDGWLAQDGVVE